MEILDMLDGISKEQFTAIIKQAVLETVENRALTNKPGFMLDYLDAEQFEIVKKLSAHPGSSNFKRQDIDTVEDFEALALQLLLEYNK